jgi:DNA-binding response OmpR family regulator
MNFDLLILDINMPVLNGQEFMKRFRSINSSLPVIALTSNSMIDDKLEMFHLGCDDYITKPFNPQELLARISILLKRSKQCEIQKEILI